MQQTVWGFSDIDLLPPRLFVVAAKIGGQVLGAFDGQRMVGFCLSLPGLKAGGRYYLHSHMLGVLPEYRDRGIGRMLKLAQRNDALARDINLIEWTFDPLEIKNARFNIERLGAVVRRFVPNQYGATSSPLHAGLPTDRLVAEWWIAGPRVRAIVEDTRRSPISVQERIEVPIEIGELKKNQPQKARQVQARLRKEFEHWFSRGLTVIGYEITPQAGAFLLGTWSEKE
ncbi:MAG: GNAT family N-acetyltransferase [Acidobacteria bacterium]|nr:GNAT family N-acetyltransferase [Acidobacteriota bacterium]